jgi:hypothetical protein
VRDGLTKNPNQGQTISEKRSRVVEAIAVETDNKERLLMSSLIERFI